MLAIFLALILAVSITYFVNDWYSTQFDVKKWQKKFYSQNFDPNQKKIYLVGSSQVHRLNATFIEKYISQTENNYKIYNLGIPGDKPIRRINQLEEMIESKPIMVVYGITFKDFEGSRIRYNPITDVIAEDKQEDNFLEPWKFLHILVLQNTIIDLSNFENPQLTTLKLFEILKNPKAAIKIKPPLDNTPFLKYRSGMYKIIGEELLKIGYRTMFEKGDVFTGYKTKVSDNAVFILKEVITKLKENNIKVVLFSVPYPKYFLEKTGDSNIEIFTSALNKLSEELDVKVYHLNDKYADLNIWADPIHVSTGETAMIYSSDLAQIILDEIKS